MSQAAILYPIVAMMLLVSVVAVQLLRERMAEMKARRIHPRQVPSSSQLSTVLQNTRAADNYKNLFEMPVLFYALCLALFATQLADSGFVLRCACCTAPSTSATTDSCIASPCLD